MSTLPTINQVFYISTGAKNVMFTLRMRREGGPGSYMFMPDFYLCTLAATQDKAVEKAQEYVEAFRSRVGESEHCQIIFDPCVDHETFKRRGKLSARETRNIQAIEDGMFPFGKHAGTQISDAPESYVLYFADKTRESGLDLTMQALAARCAGVALELGYIARRDERRAVIAELDAKSEHVGKVGERIEFEGVLFACFERDGQFGSYFVNKVRCGDNIVTYMGSKSLGERGETVKFRATVKKHESYKNVKSTAVSRPQ